LLASTNAFGRVIDDWNLDQTGLTINYPADPMGIRKSNSIAGTEVNVLGGERDMANMLIQGSVPGEFDVKVQSGLFIFDQGMTLYGTAMVQWDGYDSSPSLNPTGLGGIDFTSDADMLKVRVVSDDLPSTLMFRIYTDDTSYSTYELDVPGGICRPTVFDIKFDDFAMGSGAAGPADFASIGALTMEVMSVNGVGSLDLGLDYLETVGANHTPTINSFTAMPDTIPAGGTTTLSWSISIGAEDVSIDHGVGSGLPASGSVVVSPVATTTYALTAKNSYGSELAAVTVTVQSWWAPASVFGLQSKSVSDTANNLVILMAPIGTVLLCKWVRGRR